MGCETAKRQWKHHYIEEHSLGTVKAEMGVSVFATREAARTAVFDYIEGFYNASRRHSSIGYMSPSDYERAIAEEVRVA